MKYLIVYASAGAGHKKAADAIYEALTAKIGKKDVAIADSLDYANRFFRWSYSKKYLTLVSYLPGVWGFFYYLFDNRFVYKLIWLSRRLTNAINCRRFEEFVCQAKPEVIISTHFMANEIISRMKRKGKISCKLFCAVTDYRLHSFWLAPNVDGYFVAIDNTKLDLLKRGVPADKVHVTGIPISPRFSINLDKQKTQVKLGLNIGLFTVLVIGGGFGVGPIEELVKKISALELNIQFMIVCGHNKELCEKINALVHALGIKAKFYGFVDNVDELMSASDILVTKSGGLTSSEALAKGLPAIFIRPIPGQEKRNSRSLEASNAAIIAKDVNFVSRKIKELFENPDTLNKMNAAVKKIARPNSANDIVKIITCM